MENASDSSKGPRMLPAIIFVAVHLTAFGWAIRFGSTNIDVLIGMTIVPLFATAGLFVWWMRSRGIPRRDRVNGLAIFLAALLIPALPQTAYIPHFLFIALPVFTTGTVLTLLLTSRVEWSSRRCD